MKQNIKSLINEINKGRKGNPLVTFGNEIKVKEKYPFGVPEIDSMIGGGLLAANFNIIYGGHGVCKTTLALSMIKEAQAKGKVCCYVDFEHSLSKERMEQVGVNLDELVLIDNIEYGEEALDVIKTLLREKAIDVCVVDSIQSISPKAEQFTKTGKERSIEESEMAILATKMGKFIRVTKDAAFQANTCMLLIGQVRTQGIGTFVTSEGLSGGWMLKHMSMLTLHLRKGQGSDAPTKKVVTEIEDEDGKLHKETTTEKVGFSLVVKIEKHKISGCKTEGSEIRLPYYYETLFKEVKDEVTDEAAGLLVDKPKDASKAKQKKIPKKQAEK